MIEQAALEQEEPEQGAPEQEEPEQGALGAVDNDH